MKIVPGEKVKVTGTVPFGALQKPGLRAPPSLPPGNVIREEPSPIHLGADRLKSARGRTEPTEIIDSQIRDEHVSLTFGADLLE